MCFLYPAEIITLLFGAKYIEGAKVLPVLAAGYYITLLLGPCTIVPIALGRTRIYLYSSLICGSLSLTMYFILIPNIGIYGAAISSSLSLVISYLYLSLMVYKMSHLLPMNKRTVVMFSGCILLSLCVYLSMNKFRHFEFTIINGLLLFIMYGAIAFLCCFLFGTVTHEDKKLLYGLRKYINY